MPKGHEENRGDKNRKTVVGLEVAPYRNYDSKILWLSAAEPS
jgi:hypothetical protein